jgi:large subunit ribosomal protein L25
VSLEQSGGKEFMSLIVVSKRELGGSRATKLRRQGIVPMAFIERTHNTVPIQAPVDEVRRALSHPDSHGRIEVQIEGDPTKRRAIIKQVEQDAIRHLILTITLQEVADDDMLRIDVPVVAVGTPKALEETSGTILSTSLDHIKIRGKVSDLPDHIEVDVSNLELGHHITAG